VRMTQWLCTALMAGAACTAAASDYPSKPVKLIVGYPAGGGADIVGRAVAQKLAGRMGQPIVVENRGGAAGVIATAAAASAPADGYTLLLGHVNAMAIAQSSATPPSYDTAKDFAPVAYIGFVPNILVVHPSNPARSVADLVAQAKKAAGKLSFASPGVGSTNHLAGEMFKSAAGIDIIHVPYRGSAPAITDLLGGQITMNFDALSSVSGFLRQGKMRPLAVSSRDRNPAFPDVPTMGELGYRNFDVTIWYGIVAPAHTPEPIVAKLNGEINRALGDPALVAQLGELGVQVETMSPAEFGALIQDDVEKYARVIKQAGITIQ